MSERMKLSDDEMVHDDIDAWIDGLLSSDEARPSAPSQLRAEVRRLRRRKRWAACGLAATAAAATLAAVFLRPQNIPTQVDHQIATVNIPPPDSTEDNFIDAPPPQNPVATFVARGDLIAVPIESGDPTVTIVQLYPTIQAQRRWRRRAAFDAIQSKIQLKPTTPVHGG